MDDIYKRTSLVIGSESIDILKKSHVVVCGVGGVGSFTVESLVRCGIGKITIIDKDVIDSTNINRQLIALNSTIGKDKVEVCKERILDINPNIKVMAIKENITSDNIQELLNGYNIDYVVDAVDNLDSKISIIVYCVENKIKCISSMGMANKINPLDIRVTDIYKTTMCPLAKKVRKRLKEADIKKQKVVYSIEEPIKNNDEKVLGSTSFVPSTAGLVITSEIIKELIKS